MGGKLGLEGSPGRVADHGNASALISPRKAQVAGKETARSRNRE
jgi:hypothetical protein